MMVKLNPVDRLAPQARTALVLFSALLGGFLLGLGCYSQFHVLYSVDCAAYSAVLIRPEDRSPFLAAIFIIAGVTIEIVFLLYLRKLRPFLPDAALTMAPAPRSAIAPEVMLIIGSIRVSQGELQEAISVYDGILNRFPTTPQAVSAAFLTAQCRYELAVKHRYNEPRCREAIAFSKAVLARLPKHPQKEQMTVWLNELTGLLIEQNYQQAVFYDTKQRNVEAAKAAYRRFLTEFADSKYAPQVRDRLAELEKAAAPAK